MKLVIDANVLFSALLKDSATRKLVIDRRITLFAPRFLILEYAKYADELRRKSRLEKNAFSDLTKRLLRRIKLVSDEEIMPYYAAGQSLVSDKKDAPYVACALSVGAELWSQDRHLKGIRVRNWTTKELMEKLEYILSETASNTKNGTGRSVK